MLEQTNQKQEQKKPEVPAVEELQAKLKQQEEMIKKQNLVLQDPTVQRTLAKIAQGQEVKFAEDVKSDQTPSQPETDMKKIFGQKKSPSDVDLDSLTNKELVDVISDAMDTAVSGHRQEADQTYQELFKTMTEKLEGTQNLVLAMAAQTNVARVQSEHKDFEKYKAEVKTLLETKPSLSIEDAYFQVKGKHAASVPSASQTETEKPESSAVRPVWDPNTRHRGPNESESTEQKGNSQALRIIPGRRGFKSLVSDALKNRTLAHI